MHAGRDLAHRGLHAAAVAESSLPALLHVKVRKDTFVTARRCAREGRERP